MKVIFQQLEMPGGGGKVNGSGNNLNFYVNFQIHSLKTSIIVLNYLLNFLIFHNLSQQVLSL